MPISFLKNHPFSVEAHFDRSLVLTFAVLKEELVDLIPESLSLDTFQDKWAFIAVAMVQTHSLRPKGFPKFMGNDFFLIGYRIFVRYRTQAGKRLRGLYIIKSETDKRKMQFFGNMFTHYNYTTTDIDIKHQGNIEDITSERSKFFVSVDHSIQGVQLPTKTPFDTWKEARRYAGPLPFTFTCNSTDRTVLIIEGVRTNWTPAPVHIVDYSFDFLDRLNLKSLVLANAFAVSDIPYYWKKGRLELWN